MVVAPAARFAVAARNSSLVFGVGVVVVIVGNFGPILVQVV